MTARLCTVSGCSNKHNSLGYCNKHYLRWRKHGDPLIGGIEKICRLEGCDREAPIRRYCNMHYKRLYKYGDANWQPPTQEERFWAKVNKTETCWVWTADCTPNGYGKICFYGRYLGAHRVAYELCVGPVPAGLHLDHLCQNRVCVNPAHLEPVTCRENLRRAREIKGRPDVEKAGPPRARGALSGPLDP